MLSYLNVFEPFVLGILCRIKQQLYYGPECVILQYLVCLFRTSSLSRSRSSPILPTHLQTRKPGRCTKSERRKELFSSCWVNVDCCVCRLEEIQSPSKTLPPESTPWIVFTGFEPMQVQQYSKVKLHPTTDSMVCVSAVFHGICLCPTPVCRGCML